MKSVEKEILCISCPIGCLMKVQLLGEELIVEGNSCPRGEVYARNELFEPRRIVTTTVRVSGGGVVPVKTVTAVRKDKIFDILKVLKNIEVKAPLKVGDIILSDVCGEGAIACTAEVD